MRPSLRSYKLRNWFLLCLLGLSSLLSLAGCRGGAGRGDLKDLFVSNRRYNIDEQKGIVRVYGRLENTGQGHFKEVEVHAILRSARGEKRGENSVILQNIRPAEKRTFALTVTSHSRVSDVELQIRKPEQP